MPQGQHPNTCARRSWRKGHTPWRLVFS